jgi:hypothetical protein
VLCYTLLVQYCAPVKPGRFCFQAHLLQRRHSCLRSFFLRRTASHASEVNVAPGFSPALSFSVPNQAPSKRIIEQ